MSSSTYKEPVTRISLPLMESFYTIQGEGYHTGKPAYFVRLGGCDVGCVWCDVKESWEAKHHPLTDIEEITYKARTSGTDIVVITGGEPLMYDLSGLTDSLRREGLRVHLETSGAHPLTGKWDWLCFSPKKFMAPRTEFYKVCDELKVIIFNSSDFEWGEDHAAKCSPHTRLFLQPEWSARNKMVPQIVEYVKKNPNWRISLQTHKYLDIP